MEVVKGRVARRLLLAGLTTLALIGSAAAEAHAFSAFTGAAHAATGSATVYGYLDTGGVPMVWAFAYGPTAAYGRWSSYGEVPGGQGTVLVAAQLTGLTPGTTYHYRLAAIPVPPGSGPEFNAAFYGLDATVAPARERLELISPAPVARGGALVAHGASFAIELRCASVQPCNGVLTLNRQSTGAAPSSSCASVPLRLPSGSRRTVTSRLTPRCLTLLAQARGGGLAAILKASLTGPQAGFSLPVMLRRSAHRG